MGVFGLLGRFYNTKHSDKVAAEGDGAPDDDVAVEDEMSNTEDAGNDGDEGGAAAAAGGDDDDDDDDDNDDDDGEPEEVWLSAKETAAKAAGEAAAAALAAAAVAFTCHRAAGKVSVHPHLRELIPQLEADELPADTLLDLFQRNLKDYDISELATALTPCTTVSRLILSNPSDHHSKKNNKITDAGAQALAKCLATQKSLRSVGLVYNAFGDDGAVALGAALRSNVCLHELYLGWNCIGDRGARALAHALWENNHIRTLDVSCNSIGDKGIGHLVTAAGMCVSLRTLMLHENPGVHGAEGHARVQAVKQMLALPPLERTAGRPQQLALAEAERRSEEAVLAREAAAHAALRPLLPLIAQNSPHVGEVRLEYAGATDGDVRSLAEALRGTELGGPNTFVKAVALQGNDLSDEACVFLGELLALPEPHACGLEALDLGFNRVGDAGALALAKGLEANSSLHTLSLWGNRVGDEGCSAFAKALLANGSLRSLCLWGNPIASDQGGLALAVAGEQRASNLKHERGAREKRARAEQSAAKAEHRAAALAAFGVGRGPKPPPEDEGGAAAKSALRRHMLVTSHAVTQAAFVPRERAAGEARRLEAEDRVAQKEARAIARAIAEQEEVERRLREAAANRRPSAGLLAASTLAYKFKKGKGRVGGKLW
jgi:hypothetical protein